MTALEIVQSEAIFGGLILGALLAIPPSFMLSQLFQRNYE